MEKLSQTAIPNVEIKNLSEALLREKFEFSFKNFEKMEIRGVKFEVLDINPESAQNSVPVLFVPGYGKTPRSYKEALFELYKSGRRCISFTPPADDFELSKNEQEDTVPDVQIMRALTILTLLEKKALEKVDVIAHSEGGMNVTIASSMNADRFRHFIFVGLPGVTDEQSYINIIKRGVQNTLYSKNEMKNADAGTKERYENSNSDMKLWMKERGGLRGAVESMNPGRIDISNEVRVLRKSGHGVSIVAGVDDKMLPMDEYQRDKNDVSRSADELGVDGFYSIKKGHSELEVNGEVGYLSVQALDTLAKKYENHK